MDEYVKIPNVFKRQQFGSNKLIWMDWSTPELGYLMACDWLWTEKVDGTNIRVIWDGYRVSFKGRTDKADIPKHLLAKLEELFGGEEKEELFESKFGEKPAILYGEGYGEKIQKGGGLYGPVDFILFDAKVDGYWLDFDAVMNIASAFQIKHVPVVGTGDLVAATMYIEEHPKSKLRDAEMEGVVCRPYIPVYLRNGDPIRVKVKCRDFPEVKE